MSEPTIDITTTHTETTVIEKHYKKEASELKKEDVLKQLDAPVADNVNVIATELTKADPNYLKIGLSVVFIIISLCGTGLGVWFGTRK